MNKSLKILVISLIILFFIFTTNCLAVNIEMNLTSNLVDENSEIIATENDITTQSNSSSNSSNGVGSNTGNQTSDGSSTGNNSNTVVGESSTGGSTTNRNTGVADALQALPESELGLTNVLNILLIAVGFVLILLAIAIFLRLKK